MSLLSTLPAIEAKSLSKIFRIFTRPSDVLRVALRRPASYSERRALDGVTLRVAQGETVGIVGRNGAGKSTLLKVITGTLRPTSGSVLVRGRLAAILELGSGFHPQFSGRENLYTGGMCLGMSHNEIKKRFDDIVAFAELRHAIDQPFRTYSTGMQARLSFSLAVSSEPEVMIVDEALSVGDARFQLKCFQRLEELRRRGTTILLVSHNMTTITMLCDRAILLEQGRIMEDAEPKHIDMLYHKLLFGGDQLSDSSDEDKIARALHATSTEDRASVPIEANATRPARETAATEESIESLPPLPEGPNEVSTTASRFGSKQARIVRAGLLGPDGHETAVITSGARCRLFMTVNIRDRLHDLVAGFLIRSPKGLDVFGVDTGTDSRVRVPQPLKEGMMLRFEMAGTMWLANGEYFVTFALADQDGLKYDIQYDALNFRVNGTEPLYHTSLVNLDHKLTLIDETRHVASVATQSI